MKLRTLSLRELSLDDHDSLQHIEVYRDLRQVMLDDAQTFRAPPKGQSLSWSRALFLNLTWWSAAAPSDVLCEDRLPADALAHAAWHHLARVAFADGPLSADAMFLGEAIASAFDLYLVGRTLPVAPRVRLHHHAGARDQRRGPRRGDVRGGGRGDAAVRGRRP